MNGRDVFRVFGQLFQDAAIVRLSSYFFAGKSRKQYSTFGHTSTNPFDQCHKFIV